jgi:hypothetical protein
MEFENKTKVSQDQKNGLMDSNEKIRRLIESSYGDKKKGKKEEQMKKEEGSGSWSEEGSDLELEDEEENSYEERSEEEISEDEEYNGRRSKEEGMYREDYGRKNKGYINDKKANRKFQSKKEEYKKSRESLMSDIKQNGLIKSKRENFLKKDAKSKEEMFYEKNKGFLSPPKSGRKGKFKKPKNQEMNYYEQEKRRRESLERTREIYPNKTMKSKKKSSLLNKAFKKKNYGNTYSKVDTGRFTGKYKYDKKLRDHYRQQEYEYEEVGNEMSHTYTVSNLLQKKKQMKPMHRDLKPIYDNLNYTDGIRRKQKELGNSGKLHRNLCWNFENEHEKKKQAILDNYYRNFDT